jgi:hypothetical protein
MALTTVRPQGMGFNTGRRNLIINGAMQVFQRATSATTMTNTYGAVDRFRGFSNGGGAFTGEKYDMTTSDIATTGHHQALKMLVSTADTSIAAADYYSLQYKFEGDDLQQLKYGSSSAKSFTVSFFVKSNTTGTYFLTVDKVALAGTAYRIPIEYTISSANTWEKKEITVSPTAGSTSLITSSAGAIGSGTAHGLSLYWGFAWGTDYHGTNNTWGPLTFGTNATANGWMSTVGNDFYITGVQLEVGENASDFEHRSFGEELAACQRYYWQLSTGVHGNYPSWAATGYNTNQCNINLPFPVPMRTVPTASFNTGNVNYYRFYRGGGNENFGNVATDTITSEHLNMYGDGISHTQGLNGTLQIRLADGAGVFVTAEL